MDSEAEWLAQAERELRQWSWADCGSEKLAMANARRVLVEYDRRDERIALLEEQVRLLPKIVKERDELLRKQRLP